ncbi:hypothetical protein AGMMS49949_07910 [Alphaproteobacteria bacterium]|nr:hypothetical protein AGMMS49949_07910 [Alphaproteobacteria bacterium]GHS98987.1 hypothetical protein AGMMS50296_6920 [Alphaproteobacteria bacterium]
MDIIIEKPRAHPKVLKKKFKKNLKISDKKSFKKKEAPANNLEQIRQLETRIVALRAERQRLERQHRMFLMELMQKQAAFASLFPVANETQPQQSLLLALSSPSVDDFVHHSVMLKAWNAYKMQQNYAYVNLVQNLKRTRFCLQSCWKMEQESLAQWQKERVLFERAAKKVRS